MIIVFDTTETHGDLRLDGSNFTLLHAYLSRTSSSLAVPKIVIEESVNHFREKLEKQLRLATDSIRELGKLTKREIKTDFFQINPEDELSKYEQHLVSKIKTMRGRVIDYDNVRIAALVKRALHRRKPFDADGHKGFRDAILWETVLSEVLATANDGQKIALITQNSTDFGKGKLADALQCDCEEFGGARDSVQLYDGLQAFIDAEVKPHLEKLDAIREQIEEGAYKEFDPIDFFIADPECIRTAIRNHLRHTDFDRLTRWMMGSFRSPSLRSLKTSPESVEVVDAWSVESGQIAVGLVFTVNGEIECIQQHEVYYPDGDEVFSDWYDEEFIGDALFTISFTVILNKQSGEVENSDTDEVRVELGKQWPWPQ